MRPGARTPLAIAAAAAAAAALPVAGLFGAPGSGLPDLISQAPERPMLSASGNSLLLRFDGFVTNVGSGPLDVTGNPSVQGGMKQRVNNAGTWTDVGSPRVVYETADGHNHFHLMNAMEYSLWNSTRTAQVATAHKVGFCLYDLDEVRSNADEQVYAPSNFCEQGNPGARYLSMGVSAGWRDVYDRGLALQWVDVTNTQPGAYSIAALTDPLDVVEESNEGNNGRAWTPFTIPGHVASAVGPATTSSGRAVTVTLTAQTFGSPGARGFRIERPPAHGTLSVATGTTFAGPAVTYTPAAGYSGPDAFEFSAVTTSGTTAGFPRTPARATATLQVGARVTPTVQISGAPATLVAGTSAQLTASVANAGPGVTWTATAGTVSPSGLYVAPATVPAGGAVRIRATSADDPSAFAETAVTITPPPAVVPVALGGTAAGATARGLFTGPSVRRNGRTIALHVIPRVKGRMTVTAVRGGARLARCAAAAAPGRRVTCVLRVTPRFRLAPVKVVVGLKAADGTRAVVRTVAR